MNLAQALFRRVEYREPAQEERPREYHSNRRGPTGIPSELIKQAGACVIIGKFTTPVSWTDAAAWVEEKWGRSVSRHSVRDRVTRFARGASHVTRAEYHLEIAQYYIVMKLHGHKQPWPKIAARLAEQKQIAVNVRRLNLNVTGWMYREIGRQNGGD